MTGHIFIAPASSDVTCIKNLFVIKMTSADNFRRFKQLHTLTMSQNKYNMHY